MAPIFKKLSKEGISLLLALSLFVGTAGTVSANAVIDGRAEASAVEEVVTDPIETALDEVEPPAAEEAESEPPAEEETLVPALPEAEEQPKAGEQEQTQPAEPVVHTAGVTTVGELKVFMDTAFDDASFRQATLSAVLKYYGLDDSAADDEVVHNIQNYENKGPSDFASPEEVLGWLAGETKIVVNDPDNLEGIQYLSAKITYFSAMAQNVKPAIVIVKNKPAVNMQTFWGESNNINHHPNAYIHARVDINDSIMWPMSDASAVNAQNYSLPGFLLPWDEMQHVPARPKSAVTVADTLTYLRSGNENKRLVINSELVRDNGENTTKLGALTTNIQTMELLETTDTGWIYKLQGQSTKNGSIKQSYNLWDKYAFYYGNHFVRISADYSYKVATNYYSSVNVNFQNQVYGGFTFHKTTADGNIGLAGATYVVCKDGKYLSEVGGADQTAAFTDDSAQAKRFTTDQTGSFVVSPIPEGNYEVIEEKAPAGYQLDATPVPVTVTVDRNGISTTYAGAEGNSLTVNADETTLKPHWERGDNNKMDVIGGTKTETADLFIRNGSEGGNAIVQMKGELLNAADPNYTTLQEPVFTIKKLDGEVEKDGLNGLAELKAYINTDLIAANAMKTEYDSYEITANRDLIYYDTTSAAKCVANQKDDALPVNVAMQVKKIFTDGRLEGGDFQFLLVPTAKVDGDPVSIPSIMGITEGTGTVSFANFPTLPYTKPGTYTYTLAENQDWFRGPRTDPANDNIIFDTSQHTVVVTVTETETTTGVTNGLTATATVDGVQIGQKVNSANCDNADPFMLATFENKFNRPTGSLTVTKTVAGDLGDQNANWNFTVTLNDTTINGTYGKMTFANGVAQIVLKHGESKTATDLPAGATYTVVETEANQNGYATTATDATGTIEKDQTKTAAFTNTYNSPLPVTGGSGTTLFTLSGLGLIAVAAGALMYQYMKRRKKMGGDGRVTDKSSPV